MERKVCFISEAGNWGMGVGEGRLKSKGQFPLPHPANNQWARAFIGGGRGPNVETAQSALTVILELVMRWSDQCHLDCFKYS